MIITSKIEMDLALSGQTPEVEAVQDDKYSRNLEVSLLAAGTPWEVPAGTYAVVRYMKPDGTGGSYDTLPDGSAACSISGSAISFIQGVAAAYVQAASTIDHQLAI